MAKAIVYLPSPSCQIKSSTPHHEPSSRHIKILSEPISRRGPPFTFSLFSSQMPTHFSISKSMAHWINLSPLCVAMTRQSSDFMAEWISVIKETTSKTICLSHPSVIAQRSPSAAHHSKTTASHGERAARAGCIHHNAFRERERERQRGGDEEGEVERPGGSKMRVGSVSEIKWGEQGEKTECRDDGKHNKKEEETDGDSLLFRAAHLRAKPLMLPCCAHRCLTESVLPAPTSLWSNLTRAPLPPLITHYSSRLRFYKSIRPKQTAHTRSSGTRFFILS